MVFVTVAVVCMYAILILILIFLEMCTYITYAPGHEQR